MRERRKNGEPPPALFLGAGASAESGLATMTELFASLGCKDFESFCDLVEPWKPRERYRHLSAFLQTKQPEDITPGYRALAALCAENYFDLVLTTNLDPLVDDALADARLRRRDYLLLVNGIIEPSWFGLLLSERHPRVKVVKIHGDLYDRCMAWTPNEMSIFVARVAPDLRDQMRARDVFVVGHSLRDEGIRDLVLHARETIWYTHPRAVPDFLERDDRVRAVIGPECTFEGLLPRLAESLGVSLRISPRRARSLGLQAGSTVRRTASTRTVGTSRAVLQPPQPVLGEVMTVDDLMASVVAVAGSDDHGISTAFVVHGPNRLIAEGWSVARELTAKGRLKVMTRDGHRLEAKVLHHDQTHPFGPLFAEVPSGLSVPGLALATVAPGRGAAVRMAVAAGSRVGISDGRIIEPKEQRLTIEPIGLVDGLVAIDGVVRPGASGAPVVDAAFNVVGYIVAGSDKPPCFMYPSTRWSEGLG